MIMKARIGTSVVDVLLLVVIICACCSAEVIGRPRYHLRGKQETLDDAPEQLPLSASSPKSFSMDDLSTLLHSNVAVEPIGGVQDEIVVDEDDEGRGGDDDLQAQALYQAPEVDAANTRARSAPSLDNSDDLAPRSKVLTNGFQRQHGERFTKKEALKKAMKYSSPPDYYQFQRPANEQPPRLDHRSPCPTPRPTRQRNACEETSPTRPPRLRPAYRLHIRANGHGLESFLHSLITAITTFKADRGAPESPGADDDTVRAPSEENEVPPRARPVSDTYTTSTPSDEQYTKQQTEDETTNETQSLQTLSSFRQREPDEFAFSEPPPTALKPARSKLVDADDVVTEILQPTSE